MSIDELKPKIAQKMVGLVDIPQLSLNIDSKFIHEDVKNIGSIASIASITTFAKHIPAIRDEFGAKAPLLSAIINYPDGGFNTYNVQKELNEALEAGADEIDIVFPYQALVNRQAGLCLKFLQNLREEAGDAPLTLTIEAGILQEAKWVRKASELAIRSGMNFIKTSSGRNRQTISIAMIKTILFVIQDMNPEVGIHINSSSNNFMEASQYLEEAINRLGYTWVNASHFRLSGPNLVASILEVIQSDATI